MHAWLIVLLCAVLAPVNAAGLPQIILPKHRLSAQELAVIVNDRDPLSVKIGDYYRERRGIPAANVIHIDFDHGHPQLAPQQFAALYAEVTRKTPAHIQAYALTWAQPYRVGCMSITAAFTFGYHKRWCSAKTCATTAISPYYNSDSAAPYTDHKLRPALSIAATDFEQARALIERGIASDGSRPTGTAYLVSTTDKARNVRSIFFERIQSLFSPLISVKVEQTDALQSRADVLFYITGRTFIDHLDSLTFLPGAIADHLTSSGGRLTDSRQMSALRWLEAGATGSYGTVVEPCAHISKFPHPGILLQHYLRGETLIEAYWKSVQMPGEGIFIGEPLAAPFDFLDITREVGQQPARFRIRTWSLAPGLYRLEAAPTAVGPYRTLNRPLRIGFPVPELELPDTGLAVYRLLPLSSATARD